MFNLDKFISDSEFSVLFDVVTISVFSVISV